MRYRKPSHWLHRAPQVHPLPIIILLLLLAIHALHHYPFPTLEHPIYTNSLHPLSKRAAFPPPINPPSISKSLVIAATPTSNLNWLSQISLTSWKQDIYISNITVNNGNEALAYLSYIIDNYDNLSDITLFHHDHYTSRHQTLPSPIEIFLLRPEYVLKESYVSLRCPSDGDDQQIVKLSSPLKRISRLETHAARLLEEFLGKEEVQRIIGDGEGIEWELDISGPCCASFAVSRERILGRGREVWVDLRQWLVQTDLDDWAAGRIFEWTWHIWFGMEAVLCPPPTSECDLYGIGENCGHSQDFVESQVKLEFESEKYPFKSKRRGRKALGNQ